MHPTDKTMVVVGDKAYEPCEEAMRGWLSSARNKR